jgi:hypothetical protein
MPTNQRFRARPVSALTWRQACCVLGLFACLFTIASCTARQPTPGYAEGQASIEESTQPSSAGDSVADRIGQVGVAVLMVIVAVGGVVLPLLLL